MAYFQTQKSQFEYILEGLAMEEVDIFCCHVVYFTRFGIFCGLWVHFVAVLVHFMVILVYLSVLVCCNKKHLATLKYRMVVPWWLCIGRTPEPRDSFRHLAGKPKVQFLSYFLKPGGKAIYCLQPNAKAIPIGERIQ
jgi:hypothetical protein